jgi:hypothetical protein
MGKSFDNQHGYHHRHFMGETMPVEFVSFEELENQFDQEWVLFHKGISRGAAIS